MWSKLQKQLYNLMDMSTGFQIHCSVYKTKSAWTAGYNNHSFISLYGLYLEKESLVDIKRFQINDNNTIKDRMFWPENYTWVSDVIREYINTPKEKLLTLNIAQDKYDLVKTLRKFDRRLAKTKREKL